MEECVSKWVCLPYVDPRERRDRREVDKGVEECLNMYGYRSGGANVCMAGKGKVGRGVEVFADRRREVGEVEGWAVKC